MKFQSKFGLSYSRKCTWKCRLRNGGHFVQGIWVKVCTIWSHSMWSYYVRLVWQQCNYLLSDECIVRLHIWVARTQRSSSVREDTSLDILRYPHFQDRDENYDYITAVSHDNYSVRTHRQLDCLFKNLFRPTTKKTSKVHITGSLLGKSVDSPHEEPVKQKAFPSQGVVMNILNAIKSLGRWRLVRWFQT